MHYTNVHTILDLGGSNVSMKPSFSKLLYIRSYVRVCAQAYAYILFTACAHQLTDMLSHASVIQATSLPEIYYMKGRKWNMQSHEDIIYQLLTYYILLIPCCWLTIGKSLIMNTLLFLLLPRHICYVNLKCEKIFITKILSWMMALIQNAMKAIKLNFTMR